MAKSATTTFDISKVSAEVLEGSATWNQIKENGYTPILPKLENDIANRLQHTTNT